MDLFGKSPRPVFTDAMWQELAEFTAKCLGIGNPYESDYDNIKEILGRSDHNIPDGFELGKKFEMYYEVDANIVSELDCVSSEASSILSREIARWVITDDIKPEHPIGAEVPLSRPLDGHSTGTIVGYYEAQGQYKVRVAGMPENHAYLLDYEKLPLHPEKA